MSQHEELLHTCVRTSPSGVPVDQARLTDRQCVGVVLQAASLLAHFEHGGWCLATGWGAVRLTGEGLLETGTPVKGAAARPAQGALRALLLRLFRSRSRIEGRGEARRAARSLAERWRYTLAPRSADRAVVDVLAAAGFLWQPAFAAARMSLVAEHRLPGRSYPWVAGVGASRRRLLAGGRTRTEIERALESGTARGEWEGWLPDRRPLELASAGRHRQAVATWRGQPPESAPEGLAYGRSLYALGLYEQCLAALRGQRSIEARLLRAWCQLYLGELRPALRTVRRLESQEIEPSRMLDLAAVTLRVLANLGKRDEIGDHVARVLRIGRGRWRPWARLLAAAAAWDLGDTKAMSAHLEVAEVAANDPELAWHWHKLQALRCFDMRDGLGMVGHLREAFVGYRGKRPLGDVGRLWNELCLGRALIDDLPGAERACRHAYRLLSACEGPASKTLALTNLAEIRIRRGRFLEIDELLRVAAVENRRAANARGLLQDEILRARYELGMGHASAALARLDECALGGGGERRDEQLVELLAARALGLLGRQGEAAARLQELPPDVVGELEPEERVAVWALAGEVEGALAEAAGTPWGRVWESLLDGRQPAPSAWDFCRQLEPYRAARHILDCELACPGSAPPHLLRRAIADLYSVGATALAERLERGSQSPWRAVEGFLSQALPDVAATAELLAGAGYESCMLLHEQHGSLETLVRGRGGDVELSAPCHGGGRLILQAPFVDHALRALFAMICRLLRFDRSDPRELALDAGAGIVGQSPALLKSLERVVRLATGDLPVLILGESGTGKEMVARLVHESSPRRQGPYLPVNSAALSENLIMSDLFGHVRGAFTGADRERIGFFENARGGTIFLDEIGDLPLGVQGMLLRVLQEGEIRRLGESFARKVDVRVVAATHRDLERGVADGTFREDLYYRLKVVEVRLPPLRERGRDVLLLAESILSATASRLTADAEAKLLAHRWPGNVRELKNILQVAAALADDGEIGVDHLDLPDAAGDRADLYHRAIAERQRELVQGALDKSGGNRAEAARILGLSRQSLSYLAKKFDLS